MTLFETISIMAGSIAEVLLYSFFITYAAEPRFNKFVFPCALSASVVLMTLALSSRWSETGGIITIAAFLLILFSTIIFFKDKLYLKLLYFAVLYLGNIVMSSFACVLYTLMGGDINDFYNVGGIIT